MTKSKPHLRAYLSSSHAMSPDEVGAFMASKYMVNQLPANRARQYAFLDKAVALYRSAEASRLIDVPINTAVTYIYRDAANYKQSRTVIFEGDAAPAVIDAIIGALDDGCFFIPEQVGLEGLQNNWGNINEDDHVWHELDRGSFEPTTNDPTESLSLIEFAGSFEAITWDESAADAADAIAAAESDFEEDETRSVG